MKLRSWASNSRYSLFAGILSIFGSLPVFLSSGVPGYDSSSHVAKTAFLMYSFSHGNLSGWSEFWYSGFQLFYTYSPLTYVMAALFGWPFSDAMVGMKTLIVFTFFLSGVGAFLLAKDFEIRNQWCVIVALLYSITSPHILTLFYTGSLTYTLAFAIAPFLFLSLRITIRRKTLASVAFLGFMIALMIISNETTAYVILFPLIVYVVLSTPLSQAIKTGTAIVGALLIGFLLSAFWLIPYLKIDLSGQLDLLTESKTGAFASWNVIHFTSFFLPDPALTIAGDLGWILILPALMSIVFLKSREEYASYVAGIAIILLTIGPSISPVFYKIPLYLALQFSWRFVIGDVLFLAPLSALFLYRLSEYVSSKKISRNKGGEVLVICLMCLILVLSSMILATFGTDFQDRQDPQNPGQGGAYSFLSDQNTNFYRVMIFDHYYEAFPQYTLKGSIQGWYGQAAPQAYKNFTSNIYYCGASNRTLNALRLLGVSYVMIDYGYGGAATQALNTFESARSIFGSPVFNNSEVTIFKVSNSSLVYVSSSFPNSGFQISQNVNCNEPIPSVPYAGTVNYSVSNLIWTETKISFSLLVNQSAYVLISNQYFPGWFATDNDSSTPVQISAPGLPAIHVSKGLNHVVLFYSGTPEDFLSNIISLVTFVGVSAILFLFWQKEKERKTLQDDFTHIPELVRT
jgi:hypothetical protein